MPQDLFTSGVIKSATDFQVYKEVAGLSGLDFAYVDNTAVYHTKVSFSPYCDMKYLGVLFVLYSNANHEIHSLLVEKILIENSYESSPCNNRYLLWLNGI